MINQMFRSINKNKKGIVLILFQRSALLLDKRSGSYTILINIFILSQAFCYML